MWVNNKTVYVNSGQAINPPTINVATFDGLNELGLPYNSTDNLDYGYRDTLESQPIKMTEVTLPFRNSVFLSFFYQAGGHGEPPDPGDFLRLEFKKDDGTWVPIETLTTEDDLDPTVFYDTAIQINQSEYFHDDFRFRFISFGRKSGRFDAWHIDYVYLNKDRNENDNSFPDRSIYSPLSSIFDSYYSLPTAHFFNSQTLSFSTFGLSNMENITQPMNYQLHAITKSFKDDVLLVENIIQLDDSAVIAPSINPFERRIIQTAQVPDFSNFDTSADSVFINYNITVRGDDTIRLDFGAIDFRINDTLDFNYSTSNYYAYDDGIAEYAAGLTTTGNQMAYGFDMKTNSQDTINGLFIYFSNFVGQHSSTIEFFILDHDNGLPGAKLYEQLISVTPNNKFTFTGLFEGVIVRDTFYIGFTQPTGASIRIGLDKSNDSGSFIYFQSSENSGWSTDWITGSLMIRPRFGTGDVNTGIPEVQNPVTIYPNPNRGSFYMKGPVDYVQVVNITGQAVELLTEDLGEEKRITIPAASPGLYIVRYKSGARIFTEKILISK